jgi:hypothetical protein
MCVRQKEPPFGWIGCRVAIEVAVPCMDTLGMDTLA